MNIPLNMHTQKHVYLNTGAPIIAHQIVKISVAECKTVDEQKQIILIATPVMTQDRYAQLTRERVHPIWTKLRDDIGFGYSAPNLMYKRAKKEPGCGNEKNVSLAFGNLMSIYARNCFNPRQAWITSRNPASERICAPITDDGRSMKTSSSGWSRMD